MPYIRISITPVPDTYARCCDYCERGFKTYRTLKLLTIGRRRHKICNACLKRLHNGIHRAFTHTVPML